MVVLHTTACDALGRGLVFLTSLGVGHDQLNGPSKDVGRPDPTVPQGRQLSEHPLQQGLCEGLGVEAPEQGLPELREWLWHQDVIQVDVFWFVRDTR